MYYFDIRAHLLTQHTHTHLDQHTPHTNTCINDQTHNHAAFPAHAPK